MEELFRPVWIDQGRPTCEFLSMSEESPALPACLAPGRVAVITGAASGIGRAAAKRFAASGVKVALSDLPSEKLDTALAEIGALGEAIAQPADVADPEAMLALKAAVDAAFGPADFLMNNAATRHGGGVYADREEWRRCLEVNFWGVLNGVDAFAASMAEGEGGPRTIVNVGSKQGITNPPGNAAYNVSKSALKTYTEALEHELRGAEGRRVSVHLLIPGWTTTGDRDHHPGAWLPDQVIDYMLAGLAKGDFYILCPDNEVNSEMDAKRILWGAGDITENRPPLSRWHPDWREPAAEACR